ncbi:unnamed protein product [Protopolystoma xenopodis]|uniref:Uncharacterized protein n=1 Tax=Protopolystoma xenopodis TaxID=117903 RepID=A0A448WVA5_9PLAT|nr:unnamed protein product [Protopolystoma xenopodis]
MQADPQIKAYLLSTLDFLYAIASLPYILVDLSETYADQIAVTLHHSSHFDALHSPKTDAPTDFPLPSFALDSASTPVAHCTWRRFTSTARAVEGLRQPSLVVWSLDGGTDLGEAAAVQNSELPYCLVETGPKVDTPECVSLDSDHSSWQLQLLPITPTPSNQSNEHKSRPRLECNLKAALSALPNRVYAQMLEWAAHKSATNKASLVGGEGYNSPVPHSNAENTRVSGFVIIFTAAIPGLITLKLCVEGLALPSI